MSASALASAIAGIVGGIVYNAQDKTGVDATFFQTSITWMSIFNYIGTLFLNALKMIIVPLITSSIIIGVAGIGSGSNLGALGGKTLLFYATTTLAAILVGLIIINLVGPGYVDGEPAKDLLALDAPIEDIEAKVAGKGAGDVANIFLRMVPPNILKAAADGQMLGVIFFAILFGYFMTHLDNEFAEPLYKFWNGVFHVMMRMTEWIMMFAPIGVFGLVAAVIAKAGYKATGPLAVFSLAVIGALAVHALITLPLLLRFVGRVDPVKTMRAAAQPMLTAFSTASSSATLPVTMEAAEDKIGVSNKISSFVLPLGATVNMNGTALYECAAAMFIAQAYGLNLDITTQFTIVLVALLTSIGVAGIPSASLVAITIILAAIGLPLEAIGLILVVDRVLDMCRTAVNVFSDSCAAVTIARLEGEVTRLV